MQSNDPQPVPATSIPVRNMDDTPILHIASLIVHVRPADMSEVAAWLERQPGVEIHTRSSQGKLAVVMECDREKAVLELIDAVEQQPGVLNAALIYHEMIDEEDDV